MMQEIFDTDELKYSWVTDRIVNLYDGKVVAEVEM